MKNYYEELEVSKTASKEVIEKVYKVLAKKYHPDMNQGDDKQEAEEKFKRISEAYEILSNEEKRNKYDLELENSNPNISYEEYMSVVNERDMLNNALNNVRTEFYDFKNSVNNPYYSQNSGQTSHQQNYNHVNSNFENNATRQNNYQNTQQNYNNTNNNSQKRTYYYTSTGKPASAFDYFKYRIKELLYNICLVFLFIFALFLVLNAFLPFNLFRFLFK